MDKQAYFYTVDGHCARALLDVILASGINTDESSVEASDNAELETGEAEGARRFVYASRIERNQHNRIEAIRLHGYRCQACGFDFADVYGDLGCNYIEVHHVNPLANQDGEHIVNPATDLVCLCANCHRMAHRSRKRVLSVKDLKVILNKRQTEE